MKIMTKALPCSDLVSKELDTEIVRIIISVWDDSVGSHHLLDSKLRIPISIWLSAYARSWWLKGIESSSRFFDIHAILVRSTNLHLIVWDAAEIEGWIFQRIGTSRAILPSGAFEKIRLSEPARELTLNKLLSWVFQIFCSRLISHAVSHGVIHQPNTLGHLSYGLRTSMSRIKVLVIVDNGSTRSLTWAEGWLRTS